jgi:hypothetical protein
MQDLRDLRTLDPKTAAKRLRTALKDQNIELSHGECLDLVARQAGLKDWNVLSARLAERELSTERIIVPEGWYLAGKNTPNFEGGLNASERHQGQPVFWLRNMTGEDGFATLIQSITAQNYVGKRVRFSGHLRAENVGVSATIFLRADDSRGRFVAFNNLETLKTNGALKGTSDWCRRDVVLDIPTEALSLNFGFYLAGAGEAHFANFDLQIVGPDVPLTKPQEHEAPMNLDFARA